MLAAGTFLASVHDGSCEGQGAEVLSIDRRMICPSCTKVFAYTRQEPTCVSNFINHVNVCMEPNPYDEPLSAELAPFAALFRPRLHSAIAALGPPSDRGKGWPTPDTRMRDSTPSTRAIVVKEGPWYALRAGDADHVPRSSAAAAAAGVRLYLGSEAAARCPEWLLKSHVTSIINCAHNSEALTSDVLESCGVVRGVTRVALVDAAQVEGQDAGVMIEAGADAIASALVSAPVDGAVLVHCVAGVSRSASCVIAFLVKHDRVSLRVAVETVRRARPVAMPNVGFWRALCAIELKHTGSQSVTEEIVDSLHLRTDFPISTHIFGAAEKS